MTKNIDYNTTLEVTDDEGSIHLLMNIKCKVTVPKTSSPIQNTKNPTSLVLCEINLRYYQ